MNLREINENYGRHTLVIVSILIWFYLFWSFFHNGYINTWQQWRIPATEISFSDFRLIPSAAETFRAGRDPAISNPNDPMGHIFNYPKIWYIFFYTGIEQGDTVWICTTLLILFFMAVFLFPDKILVTDALIVLIIVFSPACMLLYERGNVDLVFFILLGFSAILLPSFPGWTAAVISIAAMFKYFPIFGIGIFLQEDKKNFYKYFFISSSIFLIYILFSLNDITVAWELTERGVLFSYGVYIIFDLLREYFRYYFLKFLSEDQIVVTLDWLPHITAVTLLVIVFVLALREKGFLQGASERDLAVFRMGALIYVGSFLLGNNWDYRLTFLIFTMPQLSRWMFSLKGMRKLVVFGIFLSLLFSCWSIFLRNYSYEFQIEILDEIINWALFGGLGYLLAASAPQWVRNFEWFSIPRFVTQDQS